MYFIINAGIEQWEIARDIGDALSDHNHQWSISFTTQDFDLSMKRVEQEEFLEFKNLNKAK